MVEWGVRVGDGPGVVRFPSRDEARAYAARVSCAGASVVVVRRVGGEWLGPCGVPVAAL